jgi:hypothetical protein
MNNLHIFRSGPWQPMTEYDVLGEFTIRNAPRKLFRCHECNGLHQARNLEISVDYDRARVRCKDGKHPGWV